MNDETRDSASRPGPSTSGQSPDPAPGRSTCRCTSSTTFAQDGVGGLRGGYEYARTGNPTRTALEERASPSLEGAAHGRAFASGLAAEDCRPAAAAPGRPVLLGNDAYGGTFRLIAKVFGDIGITWSVGRPHRAGVFGRRLDPATKLVWIETPTNPTLTVVDIEAIAEVAHQHGALCIVDNTFATPYLQQPLALGADVVVHSTTKYLGGHSDVVGGFVATNDDRRWTERFAFLQNAVGAVPARSTATCCCGASRRWACAWTATATTPPRSPSCSPATRPSSEVYYPGSPEHPGHGAAAKQMRDFGGMVSFLARGGRDEALRDRCRDEGVHARRVAGRGRVADRTPGSDDPRLDGGFAVAGQRCARPAVGRPGVRRRPDRRPARVALG